MEEIVDENKFPVSQVEVQGETKFHFGHINEIKEVDRYSDMPPLEEIKKFEANVKKVQKSRKNPRTKAG